VQVVLALCIQTLELQPQAVPNLDGLGIQAQKLRVRVLAIEINMVAPPKIKYIPACAKACLTDQETWFEFIEDEGYEMDQNKHNQKNQKKKTRNKKRKEISGLKVLE